MYQEEIRSGTGQYPEAVPVCNLSERGSVGCKGETAVLLPTDMANAKLGELPIAMAYVPPQKWQEIFEPDAALREGTQFRELALPFTGGRSGSGCKGGCRG